MASYQGHLMFSSVLGAGYGCLGSWKFNLDWGPVFLGAGVTTLGGLLPDLDSDSGVPVREMFNLAAAIVPLLCLARIRHAGFSPEETMVILGGLYALIRFGVSRLFRYYTVHRGMFHSIPALLISGLAVYLMYHPQDQPLRLYIAGGVMLGFLSHLVLDELYSVDFTGAKLRLNKYAGSALKFWSPSLIASVATYLFLAVLAGAAWLETQALP
jgi:hypothetical protein